MFRVQGNRQALGQGANGSLAGAIGTVTSVTAGSVFVQWHDCAVEDEMDFEELVSTGAFDDHIAVVLAELSPPEEEPPTVH
jgi:hypothetical protein